MGWDQAWVGFRGWALAHMLVGSPDPRRVHVFSRIVEEHPTCATANRMEYALDGERMDEGAVGRMCTLAAINLST